eukprot:sb/3472047/
MVVIRNRPKQVNNKSELVIGYQPIRDQYFLIQSVPGILRNDDTCCLILPMLSPRSSSSPTLCILLFNSINTHLNCCELPLTLFRISDNWFRYVFVTSGIFCSAEELTSWWQQELPKWWRRIVTAVSMVTESSGSGDGTLPRRRAMWWGAMLPGLPHCSTHSSLHVQIQLLSTS